MERFPGRGKAVEEIYLAGWGFGCLGRLVGLRRQAFGKRVGKMGEEMIWQLGV